jgi:hypothetical protein
MYPVGCMAALNLTGFRPQIPSRRRRERNIRPEPGKFCAERDNGVWGGPRWNSLPPVRRYIVDRQIVFEFHARRANIIKFITQILYFFPDPWIDVGSREPSPRAMPETRFAK